jgi:hypothetical protein
MGFPRTLSVCWSTATRRPGSPSRPDPTRRAWSTDEDESLRRYGLRPSGRELDAVRALLEAEAAKERRAQGDGDTELMKLCCVQLFNAAEVGDALAIWRAKTASFDAHCSIDVQLLCSARLARALAGAGASDRRPRSVTSYRSPWAGCARRADSLPRCRDAGHFGQTSTTGARVTEVLGIRAVSQAGRLSGLRVRDGREERARDAAWGGARGPPAAAVLHRLRDREQRERGGGHRAGSLPPLSPGTERGRGLRLASGLAVYGHDSAGHQAGALGPRVGRPTWAPGCRSRC